MPDRRPPVLKLVLAAFVIFVIAASVLWVSRRGGIGSLSASPGSTVAKLVEDPPVERPLTQPARLEPATATPARVPASHPDAPIAAISGEVLNKRAPLPDAIVAYGPVGSDPEKGKYVSTDQNGRFRIQPEHDADVQLVATKDHYPTAMRIAKPGDQVTMELESPSSVGSISGRLVDASSRAGITTFKLSVGRELHKLGDPAGWQWILSRNVTDSDGWFNEPLKIPESETEISTLFQADGFRDTYVPPLHVLRSAHVDMGEVAIERIGGVHSGFVVDDRNGSPISGAQVTPISDKGFPEDFVNTDEQGHFALEHMRAESLAGFVASADDFETLYLDLRSGAGQRAGDPPVLRLKQGVILRGKVVSNAPLPDKLYVGWWSEEASMPFPGMQTVVKKAVLVSSTGEFVLEHVPARVLTVGLMHTIPTSLLHMPVYEHLAELDFSDGQGRTVDFELGQGAALAAKIVGARERTGVTATLARDGGARIAVIETVGGGAIEFHDLPAGQYVLRIASTNVRHVEVVASIGTDKVDLGEVDVSELFKYR